MRSIIYSQLPAKSWTTMGCSILEPAVNLKPPAFVPKMLRDTGFIHLSQHSSLTTLLDFVAVQSNCKNKQTNKQKNEVITKFLGH